MKLYELLQQLRDLNLNDSSALTKDIVARGRSRTTDLLEVDVVGVEAEHPQQIILIIDG